MLLDRQLDQTGEPKVRMGRTMAWYTFLQLKKLRPWTEFPRR